MSETSQPVTPQYLLEGAAYALEQCGWLLRDANTLYKAGAYANAVVLASFAREELGRWTMLLDLRREVVGGKQLTVDDVKERCGDHVAKQKAAMLSTTMRTNKDTGLGKLLNARFTAKPGSSERKAADKQVDDIDRRLQKRVPGERHEQRMSALYVDPISPTEWNRPSESVTQEDARQFLTDAANDYSIQCERYTKLSILEISDPELSEALAQWTDRPEILPPGAACLPNLASAD